MTVIRTRTSRCIMWVSVLLLAMSRVESADFYVDASTGNDANAGTSIQPWKSLGPANARAFAPGDRLLLTSGQTFIGPLWLDAGDVGTAASPISVTSTGTAAATISVPGDTPGINVYNAGGFAISNLIIVGPWARTAQSANTTSGLSFYCDILNQRKPYIRIDQVEVSGFRDGIAIGGGNGAAGFTDVRITRSRSHDNQRTGLGTYAKVHYGVTQLYVGHCTFDNNPGDPTLTTNSGSGLVLGCVDSAIVERCVAHDNGIDCHANEGGCGIWAYDSNNVTFQDNESYSNKSSGVADGDGFDLDGACTNCIMQRNYAHDNDAAGFLCWEYAGAATWSGNVIRYNISQNDCRRLPYGAIHLGTSGPSMGGAEIHHNTIYLSGGAANIAAIRFATSTTGFNVRDNIFITTGGIPIVSVSSGQSNLVFNGNDYWSSGDAFQVSWSGNQYTSLSNWRTATGQEASGGFSVDPLLMNAGGGGIIGNVDNLFTLTAYQLQATSPLIDRGVSLGTEPLGPSDFFGSSLPQGAASDIGAHERAGGGGNTAPTVSTVANQTINQGAATGVLAVTVGDAQTAAGSLTLTGSAANTTLLPASGISIGGSGANRTITLTPAAGINGSTLVTLTVSDGSLTSSSSFTLNVQPVSDMAPAITAQPGSATVTAPATATFSVVASGSPTPTYQWSSAPSGSSTFTAISGATSASYTTGATSTAMSGTQYRCVATNSAGSATSNVAMLTFSVWSSMDIGAVAAVGSSALSGGIWTLRGSGADIWGTSDEFRFTSQSVSGDVEITARVTGVQNTSRWAKAGVMVRETLGANSSQAFTCLTANKGPHFRRRLTTGGSTVDTGGPSVSVPGWVRLERIGNVFISSVSSNGTTWTEIRRETITMAAAVQVGLAVTSNADGTLCTATFSDVTVISTPIAVN